MTPLVSPDTEDRCRRALRLLDPARLTLDRITDAVGHPHVRLRRGARGFFFEYGEKVAIMPIRAKRLNDLHLAEWLDKAAALVIAVER